MALRVSGWASGPTRATSAAHARVQALCRRGEPRARGGGGRGARGEADAHQIEVGAAGEGYIEAREGTAGGGCDSLRSRYRGNGVGGEAALLQPRDLRLLLGARASRGAEALDDGDAFGAATAAWFEALLHAGEEP